MAHNVRAVSSLIIFSGGQIPAGLGSLDLQKKQCKGHQGTHVYP